MSLIKKKNFICEEKPETVIKVKLVTKIKKHNQLYFGTLVLGSCCHCGDSAYKIRTSFKTLASKKAATWRLNKISD